MEKVAQTRARTNGDVGAGPALLFGATVPPPRSEIMSHLPSSGTSNSNNNNGRLSQASNPSRPGSRASSRAQGSYAANANTERVARPRSSIGHHSHHSQQPGYGGDGSRNGGGGGGGGNMSFSASVHGYGSSHGHGHSHSQSQSQSQSHRDTQGTIPGRCVWQTRAHPGSRQRGQPRRVRIWLHATLAAHTCLRADL